MGESRQELLSWLNGLLQLRLQKVEQCGTGAPICQLFDILYPDRIKMRKVNFKANSQYAYIQNWKVLQEFFSDAGIDKAIDIPALIKCKMQDNLEFLQWTKRHWDLNVDTAAVQRSAIPAEGIRDKPAATRATRPPAAVPKTASAATATATLALKKENAQLTQNIVELERERDFYFGKLRDIELLIQQAAEEDPEIEKQEDGMIKYIQNVLYSTEEGFEIPAETEDGAGNTAGEEVADDQETF